MTCKRSTWINLQGLLLRVCETVCRLHRSIYGLRQYPCAWFEKFHTALIQFGFSHFAIDYSLFVQRSIWGVIVQAVYVDDIVIIGEVLKP